MVKRILKVVAVTVVLLLALATGVELWLGRWFSQDPLDLLQVTRDSADRVDSRPFFADGEEFILRYDHWGFRGDGGDPSRISILTLGGQATAQPLLADDKTWQSVLQGQFQGADRADVVVANAGRIDQDSARVLAALRQWLVHVPDLHPRFVLVMVGEQERMPSPDASLPDATQGASAEFRRITAEFRDDWRHSMATLARVSGWYATFTRKSGLYRLWVQLNPPVLGKVKPREWPLALLPAKVGEWMDTVSPALDDSILAAYRQRLKLIADEIHDRGAVPVFITAVRGDVRVHGDKVQDLPLKWPGVVEPASVLVAFNAATRDTCRENGFLCLDLAREVKFEAGDFYDYVHYTPVGAEKIGRWLYGKLAGLV